MIKQIYDGLVWVAGREDRALAAGAEERAVRVALDLLYTENETDLADKLGLLKRDAIAEATTVKKSAQPLPALIAVLKAASSAEPGPLFLFKTLFADLTRRAHALAGMGDDKYLTAMGLCYQTMQFEKKLNVGEARLKLFQLLVKLES